MPSLIYLGNGQLLLAVLLSTDLKDMWSFKKIELFELIYPVDHFVS